MRSGSELAWLGQSSIRGRFPLCSTGKSLNPRMARSDGEGVALSSATLLFCSCICQFVGSGGPLWPPSFSALLPVSFLMRGIPVNFTHCALLTPRTLRASPVLERSARSCSYAPLSKRPDLFAGSGLVFSLRESGADLHHASATNGAYPYRHLHISPPVSALAPSLAQSQFLPPY